MMDASTDTLQQPGAAAAASIFTQPVVSIAAAARELRPASQPTIYSPAMTVGNVALGAVLEALCETKPRLMSRAISHAFAAYLIAREQHGEADERTAIANSACRWLEDIRAMVQLRNGEG